MMKDDKNYVYLEVTVHDPCPRLAVVRQMENAYARYFGPSSLHGKSDGVWNFSSFS